MPAWPISIPSHILSTRPPARMYRTNEPNTFPRRVCRATEPRVDSDLHSRACATIRGLPNPLRTPDSRRTLRSQRHPSGVAKPHPRRIARWESDRFLARPPALLRERGRCGFATESPAPVQSALRLEPIRVPEMARRSKTAATHAVSGASRDLAQQPVSSLECIHPLRPGGPGIWGKPADVL